VGLPVILFNRLRFQAKITTGIIAIVLLFGAVLALLVSSVASTSLLDQIKKKGAEDARDLAQKAIDPILAGDYLRLRNIVDDVMSGSGDISYVFILDQAGKVLAHTFADGFPVDLAGVNATSFNQHESMVLVDTGQSLVYDFSKRVDVDGLNLGTARVGISHEKVNAVINSLLTTVLLTTLLAMAVAGGLGSIFSKTITRRLDSLRTSTEAMLRGQAPLPSGITKEIRCWEVMNCGREDCPAHGDSHARCWLLSGIACEGEHPNPHRASSCQECRVYRENCGDEIQALADSFDAMIKTTRDREAERDQALAALRESEERWQFALEGSGEGVWDWNVQTGQVFFSKKWKAMLGYEDHEISNDFGEWESRLHPDDARRSQAAVQAHLDGTSDRLKMEHRLRCKDGSYKWILSSGMIMSRTADGSPLRMIGTHIDISERVHMQEVMIQTEKMLSLGGLAAGMAHEINNPLGGILQGAQVVIRRFDAAKKANQDAAQKAGCSMESINAYLVARDILPLLEGVREAGARAAKTVANMLEFSRKTDSGQEPVDLNRLLDKAVELCANDYDLKKQYDFRKINIERQYDAELGLVPCSPTQIEQVVLNLLRNAAQAMANLEPGEVRRITLSTHKEDETVRIDIEDTGPGMHEDVRKHIFEPFFTTKGQGVGTGLGLSVSYFIITQNHGGTIQVTSAPGHGAKFTIHLPLAGVNHSQDAGPA
jgi:PAS domain S-box-containing protein